MDEWVYRGRVVSLKVSVIETERGPRKLEVVVHPGAVVIMPLLDSERVVLVEQYRHAVGERTLEFPAGTIEEGEEPRECALRELREETGYVAGALEFLGSFFASPGYSTEVLHAYLAMGLEKGSAKPDEDEEIEEIVAFSVEELLRMIRDGEIKDAKTVTAFTLYLLKKSKHIQMNS